MKAVRIDNRQLVPVGELSKNSFFVIFEELFVIIAKSGRDIYIYSLTKMRSSVLLPELLVYSVRVVNHEDIIIKYESLERGKDEI